MEVKKTKINQKIENYVTYEPQLGSLVYVRNGRKTGVLQGEQAEREFAKLLNTTTEVRISNYKKNETTKG